MPVVNIFEEFSDQFRLGRTGNLLRTKNGVTDTLLTADGIGDFLSWLAEEHARFLRAEAEKTDER